jgi:hypothetical protein
VAYFELRIGLILTRLYFTAGARSSRLGTDAMNVTATYLQNAEACLVISAKMSGEDKATLLRLAAAWRDLAEARLKPKTDGKHPPNEQATKATSVGGLFHFITSLLSPVSNRYWPVSTPVAGFECRSGLL